MGKIVKSARIRDERYVVDVPAVDSGFSVPAGEADDRFASSFATQFSADASFEPALPPEAAAPLQVACETLRADAEAIVDRAASDAEKLLKQAESTALDMVASARAEVARIEEDARTKGDERGYAEGRQRGQTELDPAIA